MKKFIFVSILIAIFSILLIAQNGTKEDLKELRRGKVFVLNDWTKVGWDAGIKYEDNQMSQYYVKVHSSNWKTEPNRILETYIVTTDFNSNIIRSIKVE